MMLLLGFFLVSERAEWVNFLWIWDDIILPDSRNKTAWGRQRMITTPPFLVCPTSFPSQKTNRRFEKIQLEVFADGVCNGHDLRGKNTRMGALCSLTQIYRKEALKTHPKCQSGLWLTKSPVLTSLLIHSWPLVRHPLMVLLSKVQKFCKYCLLTFSGTLLSLQTNNFSFLWNIYHSF